MELDLGTARPLLEAWLREDIGHGDVTTGAVIPAGMLGRARIEAREPAVVAGLPLAGLCFEIVASTPLSWEAKVTDGSEVEAGEVL
ncbi:MAG TPA: nicotinate-nucleotide diphosphorylase (carboxylating), partial [Actinomycetota bacterium]|nr:nicotinate-nucleotide diphosphorylase (carboxylating) [Actinomycetota bacterium]